MYFVAMIIFIFILVCSILLGDHLSSFIDFPSILIVVLITSTMLMASGLFQDFKRSFKIILSRDNRFSKIEIEKAYLAIDLTIKLIINSGIMGSLIGLISILRHLDSGSEMLFPSLSVMLVTIFTGLFGTFFFIPIKARLKSLLISFDEKNNVNR